MALPPRSAAPAGDTQAHTQALWLERLAQAQAPLTLAALCGRRQATAADRARLAALLAAGQVVNLAGRRGWALVLAADARGRLAPQRLAQQAVLDHLGLRVVPLALSATALARVRMPAWARPHTLAAVQQLVNEGKVLAFTLGRHRFVLGRAGLQAQLTQWARPAATSPPTPESLPDDGASQLRRAYQRSLRPGCTMVEIGALQRALGWPLAEVHRQLLALREQGAVVLLVGEPTVLPAADVGAGLTLGATTFYSVELLR